MTLFYKWGNRGWRWFRKLLNMFTSSNVWKMRSKLNKEIIIHKYIHRVQKKMDTFVFLQYLHQILLKCQNQGQFWNLHVLSFPKLSLILKFGQLEAEKIEIKDTRGVFLTIKMNIFLPYHRHLVSFTSIFSASSWPKSKIRDSFGKLRPCRFQNCPWFWNLSKIWWRNWRKTKLSIFYGHCVF